MSIPTTRFDDYLGAVVARLEDAGYEHFSDGAPVEAEAALHRQHAASTEIDRTVVAIQWCDHVPVERIVAFGDALYENAVGKRFWNRNDPEEELLAYPVIVTDTAGDDALEFLRTGYASHDECHHRFPVLVEIDGERVHVPELTPLWDGLRYQQVREHAEELFARDFETWLESIARS